MLSRGATKQTREELRGSGEMASASAPGNRRDSTIAGAGKEEDEEEEEEEEEWQHVKW